MVFSLDRILVKKGCLRDVVAKWGPEILCNRCCANPGAQKDRKHKNLKRIRRIVCVKFLSTVKTLEPTKPVC
jgi:hypothetical protein